MWGISTSGGVVIGQPTGLIDEASREPFLAGLRDGVAQAVTKGSDFVVDLAKVDHIGAAGLMALTVARKEALTQGIRIALARPGPIVREILDISRYHMIFDILDDPNVARA